MKNESFGLQYFITDRILNNSCSQIRVMLIKSINTAKGEENDCLAGEDKKTLTIFSTLAKNFVKFFLQNRFSMAFSLLFAIYPNLAITAATRP
jgi:hypothetical protein